MTESRRDNDSTADTGHQTDDSRSTDSREHDEKDPPYTVDRANIDQDIVNALSRSGAVLDHEVRARITSQGMAARGHAGQPSNVVATLLAVLLDAYESEQVESWWAQTHALGLLRDIGDPACIEPLLDLLVYNRSQDEELDYEIAEILCAMGQPALEPTLRVYAATNDSDWSLRTALAMILARLKVRDERIFSKLVELLQYSVDRGQTLGAEFMGDYGDPRAIPYLSEAFDSFDTDKYGDPFHAKVILFTLETALVRLGSSITDEQRSKYDGLENPRLASYAQEREREKQRDKERKAIQKKRRSHHKKKRKQQKSSRKKNR